MSHEQALIAGETTPFSQEPPFDFSGEWVNQMTSTMDLKVQGSDVTGSYTSASSGLKGGGPIKGTLKGYVAGDRITFLVLWPNGSMTSWVGQVVDDRTAPRIRTLWHVLTEIPDPDEPKFFWKSTFAGADEFVRQPAG